VDVIPAIDIRGGRAVRLTEGNFQSETVYGDDPLAIEAILGRIGEIPGDMAAKCAVDGALHDLLGKICGQPLWRILGLERTPPPTSYTISIDTVEGTARRAAAAYGKYCANKSRPSRRTALRGGRGSRAHSNAPVANADDIAGDPQLKSRDYFVTVDHAGLGRKFTMPGAFAKMSETPVGPQGAAPQLGQHNHEIYGGLLGLSNTEIVELRAAGII